MLRLSAAVLLVVVGATLLMAVALWGVPGARASANAKPILAAASGSDCVSYWYVSYSGTGSFTLINTDPDGLLLSDLRFSRSYNDPTDLSRGYLDFNRDGKSDIFSAVPIGDGNYQWRYSSGGTSAWINLAFDTTPPDQLRFGDFNGDGYTDVFSVTPIAGDQYQWRYSAGGTSSWINLAHDSTPLDQLRFGDFNGDGRTDIFVLKDLGGGVMGWNISYTGTTNTNFQQTNSGTTPLSEMQFGDVDGDGHTDVFTSVPDSSNPGQYFWYYSSAGSGAYQSIVQTDLSVHDVQLAGDFNGDHRSDWFFTTLRTDGFYQWWYFYQQTTPFARGNNQLAYDATPPDQLRFADFNGDGVTDVFKLVRQCNRLANISTRLRVETGDNVLFGGFIVTGTQPKKIIIRAIGPSLPFAGKLADPILELHDASGALLETNDNWMDSPNKQAIIDSTVPPSNPLESAIVRTLTPGNYTAIVRGVNNGTGTGVVEVYDLDTSANSKLANISSRGLVETGDNVLIAGTIVVGQTSEKVIIRALGPSTGVPGAMADPTLELRDVNGALLEANDNWMDSPNKQAIIDSTIPPPNNAESAIVRILTPANYTAIVRGANNSTGIAVVEVYALN